MELTLTREDMWNADDTLAFCISQILKKYREDIKGYPANFTEEAYCDMIDTIITACDNYVKRWELADDSDIYIEMHDALELFKTNFSSFWT